ncbi:MAG TPA: MoaD/ThiS family protein [Acidimicrobiia bacterium]|nr:MoaD/ThiS family protein [Acidimicrobiia bacterium]
MQPRGGGGAARRARRGRALTVRLRLFARAREAAGTAEDRYEAGTVGELLSEAVARYGDGFAEVLGVSRVWVNGDEPLAGDATTLSDGDEVAVLPPVSGGCRGPGPDGGPVRPG